MSVLLMDGCSYIKHEFKSADQFYNSTLMDDLMSSSGSLSTTSIIGTCFFGDGDLNEALNIKTKLNDIN